MMKVVHQSLLHTANGRTVSYSLRTSSPTTAASFVANCHGQLQPRASPANCRTKRNGEFVCHKRQRHDLEDSTVCNDAEISTETSLLSSSQLDSLDICDISSNDTVHHRSVSEAEYGLAVKDVITTKSEKEVCSEESLLMTNVHDETLLTRCEWDQCGVDVEVDELYDHLCTAHVNTQNTSHHDSSLSANAEQTYVCLWSGCKVYNRPSCLRSWLERHIFSHLGEKPHRCIVALCPARFASHYMLQRHVNSHFSANCSPSVGMARPPRKGDSTGKLLKKRRLQTVRPCPVWLNDFCDTKTVELLQQQFIAQANSCNYQTNPLISGNYIAFHCSIIARRNVGIGQSEVLVHWTPSNVLPDEWLVESDARLLTARSLPLSCLPDDFIYKLLTLPTQLSVDRFTAKRRRK